MSKNYFLVIRTLKIIFLVISIFAIFIYVKPFFNAKYLSVENFKTTENNSLGLLKKDQVDFLNNKTPKNLFLNCYYKGLASWIGHKEYYYDVLNCVSPDDIKLNSHISNKQAIDAEKLIVLLLKTTFKISEVPNESTNNNLEIFLGTGSEKQTFYLAKKENGDWYFTQQNFDNPETTQKFLEFRKEKKSSIDDITNISMPILSYMRFIFGATDNYNFTMHDAFETMQMQWIPESIRTDYASFIAFSMIKTLENVKVKFSNIPGEVTPGINLVMVYTSPEIGKSMYLEYKKDRNDDDRYNWVFSKQSLLNAVDIYLDTFKNYPRTPIFLNLKHTIWENIPALMSEYSLVVYIIDIIIVSLILFYISYKLSFRLLSPVLTAVNYVFKNNDYKSSKKLEIATSLMISLYIGYFFFFNSMIVFVYASYCINFVFKIMYGVVIAFLCTEIVNVLCSFIISSRRSKDSNRSTKFAFALIIANKLVNLIIILVITALIIQELGIDMIHFLTALGIGGIAIALAGKDTIENLFGSIILAVERPIKIGDWVIIKDKEGIVKEIGLRSTKIRTFENSILTIPNYAFVTSQIDNMGERLYRRYMTTIDLDESTPTPKLRSYVDAINKLVMNTPHMRKEKYYIRVNNLELASIKILVYVFFISSSWDEELKQREQFIMDVLDIAKKLGIKFAPSQKIQFDANHSD
ncbi:mechanosensitive ion channel family protein [Francisella salimarina]|uniref:mechanosensitive ion channel family protein n=1 Tax=Francisella salimarina TaxID=2599927 RepID=UPI003751880C